jgi:metallo-beta-lactamase class B
VLEVLKPDIWLDAHTDVLDLEGKRVRAAREGVAAWVDPEGYRKWVLGVREKFDATVKAESGAPDAMQSGH